MGFFTKKQSNERVAPDTNLDVILATVEQVKHCFAEDAGQVGVDRWVEDRKGSVFCL